MVAAEAAAAGTPVIVSDRCGIAGFFEDGEALVVPYERERRRRRDPARPRRTTQLRERLARGGPAAARRMSWDRVTDAQEEIYRAVASRTAATKRLDRRLVAPGAHELARTLAHAAAQLGVAGELPQGVGGRASASSAGTRKPFSPSRRRSCAAPTRSERTSGKPDAAASLTTTPHGLVPRQQREDVGVDVALRELVLAETAGDRVELARLPRAHAVAQGRRSPSRARHGRPTARRRAVVRSTRQSLRALDPALDVDRVREDAHARSAPRATTDSRAAEPTTSTLAAPRMTGVATASLTARRQRGRGPRSWLSTCRTYGTPSRAAPGDRGLRRRTCSSPRRRRPAGGAAAARRRRRR